MPIPNQRTAKFMICQAIYERGPLTEAQIFDIKTSYAKKTVERALADAVDELSVTLAGGAYSISRSIRIFMRSLFYVPPPVDESMVATPRGAPVVRPLSATNMPKRQCMREGADDYLSWRSKHG